MVQPVKLLLDPQHPAQSLTFQHTFFLYFGNLLRSHTPYLFSQQIELNIDLLLSRPAVIVLHLPHTLRIRHQSEVKFMVQLPLAKLEPQRIDLFQLFTPQIKT
jgi:hypothetical protein